MEIKIVPATMKKISLNSIIGIFSAVIGFCWIIPSLIGPLFHLFTEQNELTDSMIALPITVLFAVPGIFTLYFGIRLIKAKTKQNIKGAVGGCAIMLALLLCGSIFEALGEFIKTVSVIPLFIFTLFVIPLYIYVSKFLMIKENLTPVKGEFIGKGIVLIISWQIWLAANQLVNYFAPVKKGTNIKEEPWMGVGVLGSIFIAVLFYKSVMFILNKRNLEAKDVCGNAAASCEL